MFKLLARWREDRKRLHDAHNRSSYLDMPFRQFIQEVQRLAQKNEGEIDFDEPFYLAGNPDVAEAVASGVFPCGYIHFCLHGQNELRAWSTRHVTRVSGLAPKVEDGLAKPVSARSLPTYGHDLSGLPRSDESFLLINAQRRSPYLDMPFEQFVREVQRLAQNNEGEIDFDEPFYLAANSDVARAVASGGFPCGYIHFCLHGQNEVRPWSTRHVTRVCGLVPKVADGLAKPVNARSLPTYGPDLSGLSRSDESFLLVFLPHLQDNLFFAGYSSFFNDLSTIFDRFSRIVIVVVTPGFNAKLATRFCDRIEVLAASDLMLLQKRPDLVFCFDSETFYMAKEVFGDLDHTIYYCQDFEAGFYPYGSLFARAEGAVAQSRNIVLSTVLLKEFMDERKLLSGPRVFVTSPKIEALDVSPEKTKRLFFYFRPEVFNSRNMPEFIMTAVESFCRKYQGYEIFLVGTVDTCYSRKLHGTDIAVISKLPKDQYVRLLTSCDVVVSLIYSAHPGVIAYQAAASGIPTVTNTFENRDAICLEEISGNIVPFDPVRGNLLDSIESALNKPKGNKSFNAARYDGDSSQTFAEYVDGVMQVGRLQIQ